VADLDFLERSNPVQIVGGDENFPADVGARKDLQVADTIRNSLVSFSLTVGTTAVEIKAGANRLENRKAVLFFNNSNRTMYWGDSSVTTSSGIPLARGESVLIKVEDVPVFIVTDQTGQDGRGVESA